MLRKHLWKFSCSVHASADVLVHTTKQYLAQLHLYISITVPCKHLHMCNRMCEQFSDCMHACLVQYVQGYDVILYSFCGVYFVVYVIDLVF